MKINRKFIKKLKRIFSLYNLAILACILIICASLFIIFKPNINIFNFSKDSSSNQDVVEEPNAKDIGEDKAKKIAVKQFKKLGEKVKTDEVNIIKIQRSGIEYYYVTTPNNNLEIRISDGKITRINAAVVE